MAGPLLHQGATVICAHAGQAQPTVRRLVDRGCGAPPSAGHRPGEQRKRVVRQ